MIKVKIFVEMYYSERMELGVNGALRDRLGTASGLILYILRELVINMFEWNSRINHLARKCT